MFLQKSISKTADVNKLRIEAPSVRKIPQGSVVLMNGLYFLKSNDIMI